jgi:hypothetical protein
LEETAKLFSKVAMCFALPPAMNESSMSSPAFGGVSVFGFDQREHQEN